MIHRHLKKTKERLSGDLDEYLFPEANKCLSPSDSVLAPTFAASLELHAAPLSHDLRRITRACRTATCISPWRRSRDVQDYGRVLIYFPSGDEVLTAHAAPPDGQSSPKDGKRVISEVALRRAPR